MMQSQKLISLSCQINMYSLTEQTKKEWSSFSTNKNFIGHFFNGFEKVPPNVTLVRSFDILVSK